MASQHRRDWVQSNGKASSRRYSIHLLIWRNIIYDFCGLLFFSMVGSAKPEKKTLLPFLGPLLFFIPQLWDEMGNRARIRLIICILLFVIFFGALTLLMKMPLP
jgi:hypothetical protein